MTQGHGCVAFEHEERRRFADEVAPADDDCVCAIDRDARPFQQQNDARRRTGFYAAWQAQGEKAGVDGVKPVNVLHRIQRKHDAPHVDMSGRGLLDEDSTQGVVAVQSLDQRQQLFGGGGRGQAMVF